MEALFLSLSVIIVCPMSILSVPFCNLLRFLSFSCIIFLISLSLIRVSGLDLWPELSASLRSVHAIWSYGLILGRKVRG